MHTDKRSGIVNNANLRMCIEERVPSIRTIVDKCTAGPCLRYERTDSQQGGWELAWLYLSSSNVISQNTIWSK